MSDDKHPVLQNGMDPDPGIDHDPSLGDPDDPAEDIAGAVPLDGGLPMPMGEVSGDEPDPSTVNQLPISDSVNWQAPTDVVDGYDNRREHERASELPRDVIPSGR